LQGASLVFGSIINSYIHFFIKGCIGGSVGLLDYAIHWSWSFRGKSVILFGFGASYLVITPIAYL